MLNNPFLDQGRDLAESTNKMVAQTLQQNADRIGKQRRHNQMMLNDKNAMEAEERIATQKIQADREDETERRNLLVGLLRNNGINV
jgi:hypothetical protein